MNKGWNDRMIHGGTGMPEEGGHKKKARRDSIHKFWSYEIFS